MMTPDKVVAAGITTMSAAIVLAIFGGAVFVIVHFVTKFW